MDPARAEEIYRWQDEEYYTWFIFHRLFKHDSVNTPKEAEARFGPGAGEAAALHILMDDVQFFNILIQVFWLGLTGSILIGALVGADDAS